MLEFFTPLFPFFISAVLIVIGQYIKPLNRNVWILGTYLGCILFFCVGFSVYLVGG